MAIVQGKNATIKIGPRQVGVTGGIEIEPLSASAAESVGIEPPSASFTIKGTFDDLLGLESAIDTNTIDAMNSMTFTELLAAHQADLIKSTELHLENGKVVADLLVSREIIAWLKEYREKE